MSKEYLEYVDATWAAGGVVAGNCLLRGEYDELVSIRTDGYGTAYITDGSGNGLVKFDPGDMNQVHAAVRWIRNYLLAGAKQ